jgi:Uma2 family endonuclease
LELKVKAMSTAEKRKLTPREYLAIERASDYKSELYNGEMFAMTGASREHNLIKSNVSAALTVLLKDRPCEVYSSDMRVKVDATGLYTYPNVVVVCGEPQFEDAEVDTSLNPTVLVEVLSPSTEDYDRGRKFAHYRKLESLKEYVLIAQDSHYVEHFVRRPDEHWELSEVDGLEAAIELPSIGCRLALREVYHKVQLGASV